MPSRYEREIEEILSRMEETAPHPGRGDRIRQFRARSRRPRGLPTLPVSLIEILFLLAIVFILVAAGLAFYEGAPTPISGAVALAGLILFVLALAAGWRDRFRPPSQTQWRGNPVGSNRVRRGLLGAWLEQARIQRLREQYRRGQRQQGEPDD